MPRFTVDVSESAFDRLAHDAIREHRDIRGQASHILERHLLRKTTPIKQRATAPPDETPS